MRNLSPIIIFTLAATHMAACSDSGAVKSQTELCEQTVLDYASFRDDVSQSQAYGSLFTDDGRFTLGPNTITGRDALIARHKSANETTIFSHVMEDIQIDELTGKSRVIVYTKDRAEDAEINRVIIADYTDIYAMVEERCLIADRKVSIIYDTQN